MESMQAGEKVMMVMNVLSKTLLKETQALLLKCAMSLERTEMILEKHNILYVRGTNFGK